MPHQDQHRPTASAPHHQDLGRVLGWLTATADFSAVRLRGSCTWEPRGLACAALLWAWSDEPTLVARSQAARKIVRLALGLDAEVATTYQAFLKLLRARTATLAAILMLALRRRMRDDLANRFEVAGFAAFAVDGSRLQLPRTVSNQARFTAKQGRGPKARRRRRLPATAADLASRRKKAEGPQMWLTTTWHVGTGLPWDWRTGPDDSSEREHLRQMIDTLPANALAMADAGFVGYQTWADLIASGRHLLVRVGANVRLLRGLGYARERGGTVYLWPDRQASRGKPPLVLRLVAVQEARHPMYLVTSVLDQERLKDHQVIELYRLRWGIELFYRDFKQAFGRRKLRSQRSENAEVEATWSLLGLWALTRHGQVELSCEAVPASRMSVTGLLRAYRGAMREYRVVPELGESLWERLASATIDGYHRRSKASRDYPRKNRTKPIGAPKIRPATAREIERASQCKDAHQARLTA
ncbi:IS4 family transposase [Tundrisphaera lichenicola]|uniref:IS4 family transposase n=1 Tax=Tundrisphaera lichenicola TaxID=2029860 RepID=UPI003EC0DA0A